MELRVRNFLYVSALNYDQLYSYSRNCGRQLERIDDPVNASMTYFTYNTTGSVTRINDPSQAIPQDFFWNEQQQLTGVKNQQGVHHYIYDHSGERIMKSSLINTSVYLNDQVIDNVTNLDPYTVYVNPFYVVTGLLGGDRVSKHYYMNQQRVATDITINYDPNGGSGGEYAPSKGLDDLKEVVQELSHEPLDTSVLTLPSLTKPKAQAQADESCSGTTPTTSETSTWSPKSTATHTSSLSTTPGVKKCTSGTPIPMPLPHPTDSTAKN
jgi:YD repeat-containing protein